MGDSRELDGLRSVGQRVGDRLQGCRPWVRSAGRRTCVKAVTPSGPAAPADGYPSGVISVSQRRLGWGFRKHCDLEMTELSM